MEIAPTVLASHGGVVRDAISASDDALKPSDSTTFSLEKDNSNNYNVSSKYDDDDDEEGDVCRICGNPGDVDNPLRYPCACSGSIKFVHQDCLLQWLNHSNARQCEKLVIGLLGPSRERWIT